MFRPLALLLFILASIFACLAHSAETVEVDIKTNLGVFRVALDAEKAPISTSNFLKYVDSGYYNGTIFHRVISDFMIQGGGFSKVEGGGEIEQKEAMPPIKNEAKNGLKNTRGTIAMARVNDPHSATSQFFINLKDNANLDHPSFDGWGYAVFGRVTDGMDVIDKIGLEKTTIKKLSARLPNGALYPNDFRDVPVEDVIIESMSRASGDAKSANQFEPAKKAGSSPTPIEESDTGNKDR